MVINVFNLSYEEVRVRVMKEDVDFEVKFFLDKCDFVLEFYINQIVICPVWCMIIYSYVIGKRM